MWGTRNEQPQPPCPTSHAVLLPVFLRLQNSGNSFRNTTLQKQTSPHYRWEGKGRSGEQLLMQPPSSLKQPRQVQAYPSHTSPHLDPSRASSTHLLEASPHFKGIPRRRFAGAPLPSNCSGNKSTSGGGSVVLSVALWPFPKCSQPIRLTELNMIVTHFQRSMCFFNWVRFWFFVWFFFFFFSLEKLCKGITSIPTGVLQF